MIECITFNQENYRDEAHSHSFGQVLLQEFGTTVFSTVDGERVMTPGRLCWIPPDFVHGFHSPSRIEGLSVFVPLEESRAMPNHISIFRASPFINALMQKMVENKSDSTKTQHLWWVMVDELSNTAPDELYLPAPQDKKLREMTDFLAANPAENLPVNYWAQKLYMAERTLIRRFRAETGMTIVQWRQHARVLAAIKLLTAGESVTQAALAVGYESLSAFIAVFKQVTGDLPSQFIRK
jgi:AraC-like DNA-binding protein